MLALWSVLRLLSGMECPSNGSLTLWRCSHSSGNRGSSRICRCGRSCCGYSGFVIFNYLGRAYHIDIQYSTIHSTHTIHKSYIISNRLYRFSQLWSQLWLWLCCIGGQIFVIQLIQSVRMNMRTFHKLSQQILNTPEQKQNLTPNNLTSTHPSTQKQSSKQQHKQKQHILNMKKANAKRIQQITYNKDVEIEELRKKYQKEKQELIGKYEKIVQQKEDYIKVLEELYAAEPASQETEPTTATTSNTAMNTKSVSRQASRIRTQQQNYHPGKPYAHTLYLHQAPLYNEICYSIQRPTQNRNNNRSHQINDLFCTQRLKNRLTSNQKSKKEGSTSSSKIRYQSTNRFSASKHVLTPACPPKYSKIL